MANQIGELATEAEQGSGSYEAFEAILADLQKQGKFPDNAAVSAVATAFTVHMADRDNFSEATKRFLALRASHCCSLCGRPTVGPSNESPTAVTNVGEAAHICAASPGGKRFVETMSPEERSHIDNAIWLCATHARLIDRDEATFTIEALRRMKRNHEAACAREIQQPTDRSAQAYDLIAVGPDVVCTGELLGVTGPEWLFRLMNFISGDFHAAINFIEKFSQLANGDRYILVNALGDGRVLASAPSLAKADIFFGAR